MNRRRKVANHVTAVALTLGFFVIPFLWWVAIVVTVGSIVVGLKAAELHEQNIDLYSQVLELETEVELLRAERAALIAQVRRAGYTPHTRSHVRRNLSSVPPQRRGGDRAW